jgi:hypothetical protein
MDFRVRVRRCDLALKLSEKRSRLFRRANRSADFDEIALELSAVASGTAPRLGFIFTNQGA